MNRAKKWFLYATLIVALAASGLTIGGCGNKSKETAEKTDSAEGFDADNPMGEGKKDGGDAPGPGMGQEESEPAPEMAGNVVYKFEMSKEVSTSQGALETLNAVVELYDAENADGNTGLISITQGESAAYTPGTWNLGEDGVFTVTIDEFTSYTSKEIEGVQTLIGLRYSFGMSGKGTVDVPLTDSSEQ